ncbi:FAD-binding oxidoreductase [Wenyingzhuangia sp. IMCC45574]
MKKIFRFLVLLLVKLGRMLLKLILAFVRFVNSKKRYAIPFYGFLAYILFVCILIQVSGDKEFKNTLTNKSVNDITQLNPIQIAKEIRPHSKEEIVKAIQETSGAISIGGGRYSMGGQIGFNNSLHFDMRSFNKILNLDKDKKQVTVQSGIVWRDLQKVIDKENLSVKIMQTYANFTVGGSVSVNCHGRYIGHGPIISSVVGLEIITASGEIIKANRKENAEVFKAAVGGYGGIGVITEVTLQLEENKKVERSTDKVKVAEYNSFFRNNIQNDSTVIFQNGDLYPPHYNVVNNVSWRTTDKKLTDTVRVTPEGQTYWLEPKLVEFVSWGDFGKWVRRSIIEPLYYRNEKVVWRNNEASYDVAELEPASREKNTYVLQEYFIPVNNIESFIPKMKAVYEKYNVNVINVSLRHAYPDKESYLSWADEEVFAFVIYYKQGTDTASKKEVERWTQEMTDAILSEKGKWYLPYQPHATKEQFQQAFHQSDKYFAVKNSLDPKHRFNNKLLDKYNPYIASTLEKEKEKIEGYYRDEGQSVLTVPEWYLVFNPKEYADFLDVGNNPSDFPFYASVDEYWKLYDRSKSLVSKAYPKNEEYNTMLQVIGVSVTMEYAGKMLYEKTVGRFFSWFANGKEAESDKAIRAAHRAYSDFIYHTAWYEFEFASWIQKVWKASGSNGANFIRRWERVCFFTMEFSFKAFYAQLIEWAAKASYETPVTSIYLEVTTAENLSGIKDVTVVGEKGTSKILGITRWGAFTKALLVLKDKNIKIQDVSGNDEIVVSVLLDKKKDLSFVGALKLYDSSLVTKPLKKRTVVLIRVKELLAFLKQTHAEGVEIEHVYDY